MVQNPLSLTTVSQAVDNALARMVKGIWGAITISRISSLRCFPLKARDDMMVGEELSFVSVRFFFRYEGWRLVWS